MGKMERLEMEPVLPDCVVCGKAQIQTPVADDDYDSLSLGLKYEEVAWLFPNVCWDCNGTIAEAYVRKMVELVTPSYVLPLLYFEPIPPKKEQTIGQRLPISTKKRREIMERDGYRCRYCGGYTKLQIDHLVPVLKQGTDEEGNLVTACRLCNLRKGTKTPEEARMVLLPLEEAS